MIIQVLLSLVPQFGFLSSYATEPPIEKSAIKAPCSTLLMGFPKLKMSTGLTIEIDPQQPDRVKQLVLELENRGVWLNGDKPQVWNGISFLSGGLGSASFDDLSKIPDIKLLGLDVSVTVQQSYRSSDRFRDLTKALEARGFRVLLADESRGRVSGFVPKESFRSIADVPGVARYGQNQYYTENPTEPRGVSIPGYLAKVHLLDEDMFLTGPDHIKVSANIYFQGGLDLLKRHNGNTMLKMAGEVEAFKRRYSALRQKFHSRGFWLHREYNAFTIEVIADGESELRGFNRTDNQGTLGALREILRDTPEIEMVQLGRIWSYDPWSVNVTPEDQ